MSHRRPLIATVAVGLVVAAGVVNLALLGWLVTPPVEYVLEAGVGSLFDSVIRLVESGPLLIALMVPVAAMMYVAVRPVPTPVSRWSLLAGAAAFFALNLVWNQYLLTSGSSTAALGFSISAPVLAGVAGLTAIPIAVSVDRASRAPGLPRTP